VSNASCSACHVKPTSSSRQLTRTFGGRQPCFFPSRLFLIISGVFAAIPSCFEAYWGLVSIFAGMTRAAPCKVIAATFPDRGSRRFLSTSDVA